MQADMQFSGCAHPGVHQTDSHVRLNGVPEKPSTSKMLLIHNISNEKEAQQHQKQRNQIYSLVPHENSVPRYQGSAEDAAEPGAPHR